MSRLFDEPTQTALWQRLVHEAERRSGCALEDTLESYLVFVLMRHAGDVSLGHRLMAMEFLQSQAAMGSQRREGLRDVGDQCLLIAGLFPERARRRRLPVSYFIDLGSGAYRDLADRMRAGFADLYAELSEAFEDLVRVLLAARGSEQAAKVTAQWQMNVPGWRH